MPFTILLFFGVMVLTLIAVVILFVRGTAKN